MFSSTPKHFDRPKTGLYLNRNVSAKTVKSQGHSKNTTQHFRPETAKKDLRSETALKPAKRAEKREITPITQRS